MSADLRVLIADDHGPTRASIRDALEHDPELSVCAEASDAAGAVAAAMEHNPDICLIDVRMPGSGLAAAWEITARLPETAVVILTVSDRDADLFSALRAGAAGYLLKDMDRRRLPQALKSVARGETALPRMLVARVVAQFRDPAPPWRRLQDPRTGHRLTSREWQILSLMREELTTSQIARRLSLTPATVRSHRARIIRKLKAAQPEELDVSGEAER